MSCRRLQALVLRFVGAVEVLAFAAVVMPHDWMAAGYAWLGRGEMPAGPVFDAVMRQVSFTYGMHGIAMWVIASDVARYRPLVVLAAVGYLAAAPAFFLIDLVVGMPGSWLLGNGGACLLIGGMLSTLLRCDQRGQK